MLIIHENNFWFIRGVHICQLQWSYCKLDVFRSIVCIIQSWEIFTENFNRRTVSSPLILNPKNNNNSSALKMHNYWSVIGALIRVIIYYTLHMLSFSFSSWSRLFFDRFWIRPRNRRARARTTIFNKRKEEKEKIRRDRMKRLYIWVDVRKKK